MYRETSLCAVGNDHGFQIFTLKITIAKVRLRPVVSYV